MQNQNGLTKIAKFLAFASPIITELVTAALRTFRWEVRQQGHGLETIFHIKADDKEVQFNLHNLLLEIVTIDRDQNPLKFDERLKDFNYFVEKTTRLAQSKLKILLQLLGQEDVDKAIENIKQSAGQYERIRIWQYDKPEVN